MSGSKLLEQAIVDAQALRDSAYKSAQAALVEKFAPQIKEAVEKLLEQDEDPAGMTGSPEDAMASDIPAGTDFGGAPEDTSDKSYVAGAAKDVPLAATDGEKLCPCPDDDGEVVLELNLVDLADALQIGGKEEESDIAPQMTGMMNQPPASGGAGGPAPMMESLEIDEVNLEEILSEGEEEESDENEDEESEEDDEEESDEDDDEDSDEEDEDEESDDEEELDEGNKKPRNPLASAARAQGTTPEKLAAQKKARRDAMFAAKEKMSGKKDKNNIDKEKADLDDDGKLTPYEKARGEAIQAAMKKQKDKTNESKTKQLLQTSAQLLKEHQNSIKLMEKKDVQIHNLLEENNKLSSTVEEMSVAFKKLEEVNTLNAKLFYENQVLKSASLNERQKTHIVEAISKADSVSEAKAMYETLINSVGGPQREERSPKSLNEAINKKSSFRLPHKQTEQPNDPNKDRWLKLAGIK
jgi:hypothetical protein